MNILQMLNEAEKFIFANKEFDEVKNKLVALKKVENITKNAESLRAFQNGELTKDAETAIAIDVLHQFSGRARNPARQDVKNEVYADSKKEAYNALVKLFGKYPDETELKPYLAKSQKVKETVLSGENISFVDNKDIEADDSEEKNKDGEEESAAAEEPQDDTEDTENSSEEEAPQDAEQEQSKEQTSIPEKSDLTVKQAMSDAETKKEEMLSLRDELMSKEDLDEKQKNNGLKEINKRINKMNSLLKKMKSEERFSKDGKEPTTPAKLAYLDIKHLYDTRNLGLEIKSRKSNLRLTGEALKKDIKDAPTAIKNRLAQIKNSKLAQKTGDIANRIKTKYKEEKDITGVREHTKTYNALTNNFGPKVARLYDDLKKKNDNGTQLTKEEKTFLRLAKDNPSASKLMDPYGKPNAVFTSLKKPGIIDKAKEVTNNVTSKINTAAQNAKNAFESKSSKIATAIQQRLQKARAAAQQPVAQPQPAQQPTIPPLGTPNAQNPDLIADGKGGWISKSAAAAAAAAPAAPAVSASIDTEKGEDDIDKKWVKKQIRAAVNLELKKRSKC